jgi:hypothetical protein
MDENSQSAGSRRFARMAGTLLVTLAVVGCAGLGLLPYHAAPQADGFKSYRALAAAYRSIRPGKTLASDLGKLGFDVASSPDVKVLSYLGVIERFMPRNSVGFDRLAPAIQSCIDARDRCTAYLYHATGQAPGGSLFDLIGNPAQAATQHGAAEVVLLVQDGRVAYKAMSGEPRG